MEGKARILIIDESEITEIVDAFLSTAGYEVATENAAQDGINRAKEFRPHLILLADIIPGMDGYDVREQLKQDPATANSSVVLLVKNIRQLPDRSFKAGCDLYIKKPFSCERLLDIVRVILHAVAE